MFAVMIDKEITQHEKKKKTITTGLVVYVLLARTSVCRTSGYVRKGFQSTPNVYFYELISPVLLLRLTL